MILVTAVIKNIIKNDSEAVIDVITKKEYSDVFLNIPNIGKIITGVTKLGKYDYLIDLHNSIRSNIIKCFIPAEKRLTYNKAAYERRSFLYTRREHSILKNDVVTRYLQPLRDIGFEIEYTAPHISLLPEESESVREQLDFNEYIAIAPGAKWQTKRWSLESNIGLSVMIIRDLGMKVVLLGDLNEEEFNNNIYKGTGTLKNSVKNLTGKTGIRQLASIIKNARVLVTTDSAAMHIGWAVEAKVVALFGPTVKEFGFQPKDKNVKILEKEMDCRPCSLHGSDRCKYGDQACMQRIEVYEVFEEVKNLL